MTTKQDIFNLMPDPNQAAAAAVKEATAATFGMQVHELEIDGVRCFWAPGHGSMTAGLVFGVGETDETFSERGFTRLIAQMAQDQLDDQVDSAVGLCDTSFWITGHRSDVSHSMGALLRALRGLPFHTLSEHASGVLDESTERENPAWAESLSVGYGFDGPGALALAATGLLQPDAQAVEQWRKKYFVKENAAAFFFGPRPEDLSFSDLPNSVRPLRSRAPETLNSAPVQYRADVAGPSVYAPIPSGRMSEMAVDIAEQRLRLALASISGADVGLQVGVIEVAQQLSWLSIESEAPADLHQLVIDAMGEQLHELAANGPELEEVLHVVKELDSFHASQDGESAIAEVTRHARSAALESVYVSYHEFRSDLATKNRAAITQSLAASLQLAIWTIPLDSPGNVAGAQPVPPWFRQIAGVAVDPLFATAIRGTSEQIVLHYEGISKPVPLRAESVAGVVVSNDGEVTLHHAAGLVFRCEPRAIGAEEPLRSFLLGLPIERIRKVTEKLAIVRLGGPVGGTVRDEAANLRSTSTSTPTFTSAGGPDAADQAAGEAAPDAMDETPSPEAGSLDEAAVAAHQDEQDHPAESDPGPLPIAVPGPTVTYSYPQAVGFAEAIVAEAWPVVERLYESETSPDLQAHFVKVAAATGGDSSRFDPWVEGSSTPGLALLVRAASTMNHAWAERERAGAKPSKKVAKAFFTKLQTAEADLLLATVEHPTSTVPWVSLLECARGLQRSRRAVEQTYINHVERGALLAGHLEFQQYMSKKWLGSHDEMWDHVAFVCRSAPVGSPFFSVAAMAFIEEWVDQCQSGATTDDDASGLLARSGRQSQLVEAAESSFGHAEFDLLSVGAARALEIFFTYFWSIGDFKSAAAVSTKMGKRYSGHPMGYFTSEPWPVIRATARKAAVNSGAA